MTQTEIACADQAGSQYESGGHGVDFDAIDAETAIDACNAALEVNATSVGDIGRPNPEYDSAWVSRPVVSAAPADSSATAAARVASSSCTAAAPAV